MMNDSFDDTLKLLFDKCIPKKQIKIHAKKKKRWLTKGYVKTSCKNKGLLRLHINHTKSKVLKK